MQRVINIDAIRGKARQLSAAALSSALVLATMAPVFLTGSASAAQITNRSITLGSSKVSTSNTYSVDFYPTVTTTIKGIVVQFCANSPLIGTSCTGMTGMTTPAAATTFSVTQTGATSRTFTLVSPTNASTNILVGTNSTGFVPAATSGTNADRVHFTFTATNPSTLGSFYARILTYDSDSGGNDPLSYTDTTPGTHIDDGGIALSTARQLTVNAKVQEQLTFCVGTVDNTVTDTSTFNTYNGGATQYCGGSAFGANPTVDLGPVSSGSASISPVATASGGNNLTGVLLTQTNAFNGATLSYFSEQNSSSGRLKVAGAACSGSTGAPITDAGSSVTDQCFNSNATQTSFATASTEEFGMTALTPYQIGTTANLSRDANYDGNGTAAGGFAWTQGGATVTLATSSTVLDYEAMLLTFAAQTAPTTPTGTYTVTSTYVATGVF